LTGEFMPAVLLLIAILLATVTIDTWTVVRYLGG